MIAAFAVALLSAAPSWAALTQWPTCSPPSGDYALCTSGGFPQDVAPGPDGAVWFTTADDNLGRATSTGGITQYDVPLPDPDNAYQEILAGLTVGPDGGLWFGDFGQSGLWSASAATPPAFAYTDAGAGDTQPRDVTLGPDGALWVAQAKSDALGRYVPGGAFTQIPLPPRRHGFVDAFNVVPGPDGRLWVARPRAIDAVTTAGVVTEYPVPHVDGPSLTMGPDGAIWFADYDSDIVGRITTGGAVTEYHLPAGSAPASITTGPDGALWVGLGKGGGIMRFATDGSWTITPLLFTSQVSSITTGPDGAIWFGDLTDSRIGRLDVPLGLADVAVTSLSPPVGPAGSVVTVDGSDLDHATRVTVGGVEAHFTVASDATLRVTIPPGAGAQPVVVTTPDGASPPTAAATFSYESSAVSAAPGLPATPPEPPTITISSAVLAHTGVLTVAVKTSKLASFTLTAALPPSGAGAHIAGVTKLTIPRAGTVRGRLMHAGTTELRLTLSSAARRTLRSAGHRGAKLEVGVALALGHTQATVGQRTFRVRLGR